MRRSVPERIIAVVTSRLRALCLGESATQSCTEEGTAHPSGFSRNRTPSFILRLLPIITHNLRVMHRLLPGTLEKELQLVVPFWSNIALHPREPATDPDLSLGAALVLHSTHSKLSGLATSTETNECARLGRKASSSISRKCLD